MSINIQTQLSIFHDAIHPCFDLRNEKFLSSLKFLFSDIDFSRSQCWLFRTEFALQDTKLI